MTEAALQKVFDKTNGHCHYCGDPLVFWNRGWSIVPDGHWEVDHVIQRRKGGHDGAANYLPACTACNRLRWAREGPSMRRLLRAGLIAIEEIEKGTVLGIQLEQKLEARDAQNEARRLKPLLDGKWHTLKRGKQFAGRTSGVIQKVDAIAARSGWAITWQVSEDNQTVRIRRVNRR